MLCYFTNYNFFDVYKTYTIDIHMNNKLYCKIPKQRNILTEI